MRHAGQVVTRTMLLENVWDYRFDPQTNVIGDPISLAPEGEDRQGFADALLLRCAAPYYLRAVLNLFRRSASPARLSSAVSPPRPLR